MSLDNHAFRQESGDLLLYLHVLNNIRLLLGGQRFEGLLGYALYRQLDLSPHEMSLLEL